MIKIIMVVEFSASMMCKRSFPNFGISKKAMFFFLRRKTWIEKIFFSLCLPYSSILVFSISSIVVISSKIPTLSFWIRFPWPSNFIFWCLWTSSLFFLPLAWEWILFYMVANSNDNEFENEISSVYDPKWYSFLEGKRVIHTYGYERKFLSSNGPPS